MKVEFTSNNNGDISIKQTKFQRHGYCY